jgi:transcriptional/translational regulatory protein YebC/TACO1
MKTNPKTQADANSSENQSAKKSFKRVSEYGKQLAEKQKLMKLIDLLEDCDDVQSVTGNYIFSNEVLEKL